MGSHLARFLQRLVAFLTWSARDRDMDQEMGFHLESLKREALRSGLSDAEAEHTARRRFGNVLRIKEQAHDVRGVRVLDDVARDLHLTVRGLWRRPLFTAVTIATLTLGLGAFAVVYTAVDKVLIEPLPYDRPDDLYQVWRSWGPATHSPLSGTDVVELRAADGAIAGAVGLHRATATISDGRGGEPEELALSVSTPELFELLGVPPALGRGFAADEVGLGRAPVVVLGHDLWQRRFGGDMSILGSEVRLDDVPYRVIGVADRSFRFARVSSRGSPQRVDAYITFPTNWAETPWYAGVYTALVRARPGTTPEQMATAIDILGVSIDEQHNGNRGVTLAAVGVRPDLVARVRPALVVLGVAAVFLVLVLMLNLATVLLGRATQREREFAVARALGASGLALTRPALLEGGVLGLLGGAGGALAAVWGTRALVMLAPLDLARRDTIAVDGGIAAVVIGVGAVLGLLASAVPARWAMGTGLSTLLSHAAVRGGGGHGRFRRGLVVVQVALSLVLLSAGGLVVQSFDRLLRADPGFEPSGVLTLRIPVPALRHSGAAATTSLHRRLQAALAGLPGVAAVGATSRLPLAAGPGQQGVTFPGAPGNTGAVEEDVALVEFLRARPGYFNALGISVLAGRAFDAGPSEDLREAVIDRTLASRFFPSGNPVGATLEYADDSFVVIGVVEHARLFNLHEDGRSQVYIRTGGTAEWAAVSTLTWALRTARAPLALVPEVRAAIRQIDPQLAVADIRSMGQVVAESLRQQRLSAVLLTGFSLGALLLAAMALFGVVSGSVTRRRHEIAVRLALGADHGRLIRLVLREGALLILLGLLLGAPGSYLSGQTLRGVLVGVSPFDPLTLGAVACGLTLMALAACYIPARQVVGIDPARSLQGE